MHFLPKKQFFKDTVFVFQKEGMFPRQIRFSRWGQTSENQPEDISASLHQDLMFSAQSQTLLLLIRLSHFTNGPVVLLAMFTLSCVQPNEEST